MRSRWIRRSDQHRTSRAQEFITLLPDVSYFEVISVDNTSLKRVLIKPDNCGILVTKVVHHITHGLSSPWHGTGQGRNDYSYYRGARQNSEEHSLNSPHIAHWRLQILVPVNKRYLNDVWAQGVYMLLHSRYLNDVWAQGVYMLLHNRYLNDVWAQGVYMLQHSRL